MTAHKTNNVGLTGLLRSFLRNHLTNRPRDRQCQSRGPPDNRFEGSTDLRTTRLTFFVGLMGCLSTEITPIWPKRQRSHEADSS